MFDLSSLTPNQRAIIEEALSEWKFDPASLSDELLSEANKTAIPVEFADLSRYGQAASRAAGDHDHGGHVHVTDPLTGDIGHGIEYRNRVLGLAWYSGKVSIEATLESDPALAKEVFHAEGAHMIDFFWMTDDDRAKIAASLHGDGNWQHADHGWFEERGDQDYYDWPGETFMDLFILAATTARPPSMAMRWTHPVTADAVEATRQVLSRGFRQTVIGVKRSNVYHTYDHLKRDVFDLTWPSEEDAQADGRRKCRVCARRDS